jgi:hypothetical protein
MFLGFVFGIAASRWAGLLASASCDEVARGQRSCEISNLHGIPMTAFRHAVVVDEGPNFHHTANLRGTTQSCVSTRIKALEEALGILLFEHCHRGVRFTEAGRRFLAEVSTGIGHLDHAYPDGQGNIFLHNRATCHRSHLFDRRRLPRQPAHAVSYCIPQCQLM